MTILLDSRVGSAHYQPLIPNSILTQLEFGDAAFEGNGVTVGVEIKKLLDAVNCMYTGRLADHQVPGLRKSYDIVYLIVEGIWRPEPGSGVLQYLKLFDKESDKGIQCGKWVDASSGRKRLMYSSFEQWLSTLELQADIRLRSSPSTDTTAALLTSLFAWYQRESHHSFHVLDETTESAVLSRPTMTRRMLALLPRVGWSRSAELARRFPNMESVLAASPEAFLIEKEIAMPTAMKVWEALHG